MNPHIYRADITRVVDGDTCDVTLHLGFDILYKGRVRLTGIDTPESRTRDLEEKKYGLAAKEFLKKWTGAGHLVLRTFKDGKGKYGRILGQIWYEDTHNINQLLIDNHHAVAYHGQSKEEIAEEHIKNREFVKLLDN